MSGLSVEHLLGTEELDLSDYERIFRTADHFKEVLERPIKKVPSLRDLTISNIFFESSTRTKLSFELAEKRLSADVVNFSASGSSLSKGETLIDTVENILSMKVDMLVLRHPSPTGCFLHPGSIGRAPGEKGADRRGYPPFAGRSLQYLLLEDARGGSEGLWSSFPDPQAHPLPRCGSGNGSEKSPRMV